MRLEGRAFDMCLRHASRKFDALEDHCHLHRQHATRARDHQRTRFKFSSHSVLSCCVCIHIAIHARWIASESNRADAPSLQKRINARTTCAPCEERLTTKSRVTTALACVDTCSHGRHSLAAQSASEGGRSPLEDKAVQQATLLGFAKSIATFTATRRRARLHPSRLLRPRSPARTRVGPRSRAVVSTHTRRTRVGSKSRKDLATTTQLFKDGRNSRPAALVFLSHLWR